MGFPEDTARLAEQITARRQHIKGEEATKHALVVPFLQVLGYDVFDPLEVQPEYVADFAKKSRAGQLEKVDYAIWKDGKPAIFVECKPVDAVLEDHEEQLSRYFNATPSVRVGLLTNGLRLKAFTDLQQPNMMDPAPFLDVDLTCLKPTEIETLRMFHKVDFSPERVLALAEEMVYYNTLTRYISPQLRDPSEAFVRFVVGDIPTFGRVTQRVVERITPILRKAIQAAILENVARSFDTEQRPAEPIPAPAQQPTADAAAKPTAEVVTTEDEQRCFARIEGWIREVRADAPVCGRDSMSYYTVHQNNVRKWFARFNLQRAPYWIALRHVRPDELRTMLGDPSVSEGGALGDAKLPLQSAEDIVRVREAIVLAYEREANRKAEEVVDQAGN